MNPPDVNIQLVLGCTCLQFRTEARARRVDLVVQEKEDKEHGGA